MEPIDDTGPAPMGTGAGRRVARPLWVTITCVILLVISVACVVVLLVSLIAHPEDKDWSIGSIFCVVIIAASSLGCMIVLQFNDTGGLSHKSEVKSFKPDADHQFKVKSDDCELGAPVLIPESKSNGNVDSLRFVAQDKDSDIQALPIVNKEVLERPMPVEKAAPISEIKPGATENHAPEVLVLPESDPNDDTLKVASEPEPKQCDKPAPAKPAPAKPAPAKPEPAKPAPEKTVQEDVTASQRKESAQHVKDRLTPRASQISEAADKQTDELKTMLGGSLDSAEEDVLREVVAENIKEEDLENSILAAQKQEEALVLLDSAIATRETLSLREAIEAASNSGLPPEHLKVTEAKSILAELDAVLAANTELLHAIHEESDAGKLKEIVRSASQAGVEDEILERGRKRMRTLEIHEVARRSLDEAINSRSAEALRIALAAASNARLYQYAPRVLKAQSMQKELRALEVLKAAMQSDDMPRLKQAVEAGRAAGVAEDEIAAGEAKINEVEGKLQAVDKLKKASAAREADLLRAALAQATDAGVSDSDIDFAGAMRMLAEIEAAAAASKELDATMEIDDVERLRSAIDGARACAVPADRIAQAEKRLALLQARDTAIQSLSVATAAKDIDALRAALEKAASAGLSLDHEQVATAQSALAEADAMAAACSELESACKAGPVSRLQCAIENARSAGVDPKNISEAEATLATLEARAQAVAEAASELDAAVAGVAESVERLRLAIKNATDMEAVSDATLRAAAAALATEERRRAVRKELELASASRNLKLMTEALETATAAGFTECPAFEEVAKILREETLKEEAKQELLRIVQPSEIDVVQLRLALEKASAAGVGPDEGIVLNAKEVLVREEAKLAVLSELESATQEGDRVDPKDPFGLEQARDRLVAGVARARELGCTDTNVTVQRASMTRRRLHNTLQDLLGATRVFCRVRPTNSREKKLESPVVVNVVEGMSVEVTDEDGDFHKFEFDAAFGPTSTQQQIFDECTDLVQSVLDGYNITIFAYGQTGAGKTFTMMGVDDPPELKGVVPRTIECLFEAIQRESTRFDITVTAYMVEVYCSKINDLGDEEEDEGPKRTRSERRRMRQERGGRSRMRDKGVRVRVIDDKVTLEGVHERPIEDAEDLFDLLHDGNSQKKVTATAMNAGSSRSHTVLGINVLLRNKDTNREHAGKILLVDLAGSERLKKSEVTGAARKEAIEINKSLTALGDVISAITLGKRVPYRNHTLTLLMSDSLGGSAKTLMFVNASPALDNADETVMALNFATRAKTITNREAAVVALQAARRGIIERRKTKDIMSPAALVVLAAVKFRQASKRVGG